MNNNNYKIIRTIFENVFQRVLECKDNESNETFYNNVITSDRVINLINVEGLKNISTNILECKKTEDRIYIITKPLESESKNIKEYIKSNKLTLKQQFTLSKNIINLSSDIFNMTDIVQQKILDLDKIYIDKSGHVIVDCNLIFEQEYDISDNETLKRMGNLIHFIFSGSEIVDYNISELIAPDILKIIVRCLTREYMYPKNALTELITSPIYKMIYSEDEIRNENDEKQDKDLIHSIPINSEVKGEAQLRDNLIKINVDNDNEKENEGNDEGVLDIYLNNNYDNYHNEESDNKKDNKNNVIKKSNIKFPIKKDLKKAIISLAIVVIVLLLGRNLMNLFNKDTKAVSGNNTSAIKPNDDKTNDDNTGEVKSSEAENGNDSTDKFFNKDLIAKVNYKGAVAEIDKDIYVEGEKSLLIKNEGDEKVKSLFAAIDFTDPDYSYMLKQQIGVSAQTKSENDLSALIVLEAYKDGKLASTFHTTIQVYNDMWSSNLVPINVTNADSLNIYIEYSGKNKVWIDSVKIDVIK